MSNDPARFAAMTFPRVRMRARPRRSAGRYNQQIHSALLRPPIALWREHEASLALRRTQGPHGLLGLVSATTLIELLDRMGWGGGGGGGFLIGQVGRTKPRPPSSSSIQGTSPEYSSSTPTVVFIEARARSLGFPAISLREWKQARKALRGEGQGRGTTSRSSRLR